MILEIPLTISKVTTITDLNVYFMDDPTNKVVKMFVPGYTSTPVILWQGTAYDNIGDWTSAQAEARINELNNSGVIAATLSN